jgi:metal-sulfur cluster biosynthetic enzyme
MSPLIHKTILALENIFDPELPINIVELGLIYDVQELPTNTIRIVMTITSPHCPAAAFLPEQVRQTIHAIAGVTDVRVEISFAPRWSRGFMSASAKQKLGYKQFQHN